MRFVSRANVSLKRDVITALSQPDLLSQILPGSPHGGKCANTNTVMLRLFCAKSITKFRINGSQMPFLDPEVNM